MLAGYIRRIVCGRIVCGWHVRISVTVMILLTLIAGCGRAEPTATPVPSTATPVPPTATPVLPTATPVPPTDTPSPTNTYVPPTNTPAVAPTSVPPTSAPELTAAFISFVDSGQRLGSARSWDVSLGDVDGDGDLDAFVANDVRGDVSSAVWLNDGQGNFAISEQSLGYGMGVELGDLDGDRDLDAFVVSWDEASKVWLNEGGVQGGTPGVFADSGQNLGSAGGMDVALGDLDGDGDLDAFVAHEKANTVWLNDGDGVFTDAGQGLGVAYSAAVGLGDLDGDGDLDALAVGWSEPGRVWLNDGTGIFADSGQTLTPSYVHIHGIALGDVDGDGDLDAFLAGDPNQVWLNDGGGIFGESGQRLRSLPGDRVALGDLDGDGDLDAFLAIGVRSDADDKVWLNEGNGSFSDSGAILSDLFSLGIGLGDLDGDGDLDAFVAHGELGRSSGGGIPNEVWLNATIIPAATSTPTDTPVLPTATPVPPPSQAALGDTWTRPTDGMVMIYAPAGEFLMGSAEGDPDAGDSEFPQHAVTLDGFWMDQTEVTNAQFAAFLNTQGNQREGGTPWLELEQGYCQIEQADSEYRSRSGTADHPVVMVSWYGAAAYCKWAGGRLPTEAEWEYAARGPEKYIYPWGDDAPTCELAQVLGCSSVAAPVGSHPDGASWCGVQDLAGNVWEWVADWYGSYPSGQQVNPSGPSSGERRVLRGGGWHANQQEVRATFRLDSAPVNQVGCVGFRCVVPVGE